MESPGEFSPLRGSALPESLLSILSSLDALGSIAVEERPTPGRRFSSGLAMAGPWFRPMDRCSMRSLSLQRACVNRTSLSTGSRRGRRRIAASLSELPGRHKISRTGRAAQPRIGSACRAKRRSRSRHRSRSQSRTCSRSGKELARQIARCITDASTFYSLSFDPPRTSTIDEYHDLHVELGMPGLTARTSTGYYDQPHTTTSPMLLPGI